MQRSSPPHLAILVIAGMTFGCAGGDLSAEEPRRLSLPQQVVDVGKEAPLDARDADGPRSSIGYAYDERQSDC